MEANGRCVAQRQHDVSVAGVIAMGTMAEIAVPCACGDTALEMRISEEGRSENRGIVDPTTF